MRSFLLFLPEASVYFFYFLLRKTCPPIVQKTPRPFAPSVTINWLPDHLPFHDAVHQGTCLPVRRFSDPWTPQCIVRVASPLVRVSGRKSSSEGAGPVSCFFTPLALGPPTKRRPEIEFLFFQALSLAS